MSAVLRQGVGICFSFVVLVFAIATPGCSLTADRVQVGEDGTTLELDRKIRLIGEVRHPGDYPFVKGVTLMQMIDAVGGFTDWSYLKEVTISRDNAEVTVNVWQIRKGVDADLPLEPGDVITVKRMAPL